MLVLARRPGECIIINERITVTILEVRGNQIRLGIQAPKEITSKWGGTSWFKDGGGLSGHYDEPRVRCRLSPCRSAGEHRQHGNRPGIVLYSLRIHTAIVAAEPIESFWDRFLP